MCCRLFILVVAFSASVGVNQGFAQKSPVGDSKGKSSSSSVPPIGWREYSDGTFGVWLPEGVSGGWGMTAGGDGDVPLKSGRIDFWCNNFALKPVGGPTYLIGEAVISARFASYYKRDELELGRYFCKTSYDQVVKAGKVVAVNDLKIGAGSAKEYRIEGTDTHARVRVFVSSTKSRVLILRVSGTRDQMDGENAKNFLESGRFTTALKANPRGPRIQGGVNDSEFKDTAPKDGLLVGLEVGLDAGEKNYTEFVRAIRPVYRVGDKDMVGAQHGDVFDKVVKINAKPGYAIGGISLKPGLRIEGLRVKFMKVADRKLDPKNSYEGIWIGRKDSAWGGGIGETGKGGDPPVKMGGDGTLLIGLIGRTNTRDRLAWLTGLGLLYADGDKPAGAEKK